MLTDSRSFLSYPRHEYFRRTLCNLVGRDVENGEIPVSEMERDVYKRQVVNVPIETSDMSMDRTHCIINVKRNKQGKLVYTLRDAP